MADWTVAAVDIAAARPCTLVLLQGLRATEWFATTSVPEAADWLVDRRPDVIAVDAPCSLSHGLLADGGRGFRPYAGRVCDRECVKRSIFLYHVPQHRGDVDRWVELGFQLYEALVQRGYSIPKTPAVARSAIEIYPHGSFMVLLGSRPLKKSSREGLAQRAALLEREGLQWDGRSDHDSLDALVGALTATRYLDGDVTAAGDPTEALIWFPVKRLAESYRAAAVDVSGLTAAQTAGRLERSQIAKFHTRGGAGFAAEDANVLVDRVRLRQVDVTGPSNELNGPDRIVNGVMIQSKYFPTARASVEAAFDVESGLYRYRGQLLEVPSDQYEAAVEVMAGKISEGKVPGATDPAQARGLVKQGTVTYQQARNIARAGNVDSITFDAKNQAVTSACMFGIAFCIGFAQGKWGGKSNADASREALSGLVATAPLNFVAGIATAQVLRTRLAAVAAVNVRTGVQGAYNNAVGKKAIERIAQGSLRKPVYGGAAINHVAKLARTQMIIAAVTTVVLTGPDFYRAAIARNISWGQFGKNLAVRSSGVAGGLGGAVAGAAVGMVAGPPGAVVGAVIGGVAGGLAGERGAKAVADHVVEDDVKAMVGAVEEVASVLAHEYLLSVEELEVFIEQVGSMVRNRAWQRRMFQAGNKGQRNELYAALVRGELEPVCEGIVRRRPPVLMPETDTLEVDLRELLDSLVLA